jgi:putative membrane protein
MMYGFGHMWGLGMGLGWLIGPLILGLVIWLIVTQVTKTNHPVPQGKSAMDILKERYAKGEIGKEEFEEKKKDLS